MVYVVLIGLTLGTIAYLFLIALILGHRRPRQFERLLFFLILSLFMVYAGGLLGLNAQLQYGTPPNATQLFYSGLIALGVLFLIPLTAHTHLEYLRQVRGASLSKLAVAIAYSLYVVPIIMAALGGMMAGARFRLGAAGTAERVVTEPGLAGFLTSIIGLSSLAVGASAVIAAAFEWRIARSSHDAMERGLFWWLPCASALIPVSLVIGARMGMVFVPGVGNLLPGVVMAGVMPGALLIRYSLRHNFLEFGAQRNLVYALSATFLALLYLALVRRVSGWLEPVLPPEATAAVLLFVLVFLFEPLERAIGPALHRRFHERVERLQRLTLQLQDWARRGRLAQLIAAAEQLIRDEFGLAVVVISVPRDPARGPLREPGGLGHVVQIPLLKDGREIGLLEAASTGSYLTGETSAALEFLAEQLPAMIDLCQLLEEKMRLERELAERERLALLGQMAASVSHNLRNPLSSMKTVLQVQLEKPDLPFDLRHDCALVVSEIDRMSAKLAQLLRFSRPSVNGQTVPAVALAKQTAALFSRDAERRNIRLEFDCSASEMPIPVSEEALNEILSNLVVNAIEAQPNGGRVRVCLSQVGDGLRIGIEDDGPGITPQMRSRIFEPFFTTKATGTGLGLAIVARCVADVGGTISCESPIRDGRGARFTVELPTTGDTKTR